ncbi:MAG TPA: diguanylate cyclase [Solirubrobacterales bacterium]|nr:diguanylate cyclase [Solirubrobacterales bacterium]
MDGGRNWLIASEQDRERMLEMDTRLRDVRMIAFGVLAIAFIICGPWIGWAPLPLLAAAGVFFALADKIAARSSRPEYWIFGAWVGAQLVIASAVLLTDAPDSLVAIFLALPVVTLSTRFSGRGIVAGVAITIVLLCAVTLGTNAAGVADYPPVLATPAALVIGIAILSTALMRSELQYRSESVVDPLTRLLNRKALQNRIAELSQQSLTADAPVGLVYCDIDHFKRVNDTVGHACGDEILVRVADLIRGELRAFELAYRTGGEEFLIVLPGLGLRETAELAERLRAAVARHPFPQEITMTMSCGAAASGPEARLDFDALWASADDALYRAKREGRNRVSFAPGITAPHPAVPATA